MTCLINYEPRYDACIRCHEQCDKGRLEIHEHDLQICDDPLIASYHLELIQRILNREHNSKQ